MLDLKQDGQHFVFVYKDHYLYIWDFMKLGEDKMYEIQDILVNKFNAISTAAIWFKTIDDALKSQDWIEANLLMVEMVRICKLKN